MNKSIIHGCQAPQSVGTYSQAVRAGNMLSLSGQPGLEQSSGKLLEGFEAQTHQVFRNLRAACQSAGSELKDIVRLGVLLTDMTHFARFNQFIGEYFAEPYPARTAVQVLGRQRGSVVEAVLIMFFPPT